MSVGTVIIKTTSTCNLACKYCYATNRTGRVDPSSRMSFGTLNELIRQFSQCLVSQIHFIWHGGEPLLAGLDFYQHVVDLQRRYIRSGVSIVNSIQTNAVLITPKWIDFFIQNRFGVGISLDGPSTIHDAMRPYASGRGSFSRIAKSIDYLRSAGITVNTLAVVTRNSLPFASQIFDFFVGSGIKAFDLQPYVDVCRISGQTSIDAISPQEYGVFMIEIYDKWMRYNEPDISIRFLHNSLIGILGGTPSLCSFNGHCADHLAVDTNGDVYHCDWFFGERDKCFGNIDREDIQDILTKREYHEYVAELSQLNRECQVCEWKPICNGGCSYLRSNSGSFQSPYYFCEARKLVFSHIKQHAIRVGGSITCMTNLLS